MDTSSFDPMDSPHTHAVNAPRHRSSSFIPSPSTTRPLKRKRAHESLNALHVNARQTDEEQPRVTRRKYSFFTFFPFFKAASNGEDDEEMEGTKDSNKDAHQEPVGRKSLGHDSDVVMVDMSECPAPDSAALHRSQTCRSSKLSGFSSKVKSVFGAVRQRKDSLMCDVSEPNVHNNAHDTGELQYTIASMEPLAWHGVLRFPNRSVDILERVDGPSTYWQGEQYQTRKCFDARKDPFRNHPPQESLVWHPEHVTTPTDTPKEEAPLSCNLDRWQTMPSTSPVSIPRQNHSLSHLSCGFTGFLGRKRPIRKGKKRMNSPCPSRGDIASSRTPPIGTTQVFLTSHRYAQDRGHGSGSRPDFSISINEMGVLPASDAPSIANYRDITYANSSSSVSPFMGTLPDPPSDYQRGPQSLSSSTIAHPRGSPYPSRQSSLSRPGSAPVTEDFAEDASDSPSCSMTAYRADSPCPPRHVTPALNPVVDPFPGAPEQIDLSALPAPLFNASTQPSNRSNSTRCTVEHEEGATHIHHHTHHHHHHHHNHRLIPPRSSQPTSRCTSNGSQCTAVDDASEHEGLQLRRKSRATSLGHLFRTSPTDSDEDMDDSWQPCSAQNERSDGTEADADACYECLSRRTRTATGRWSVRLVSQQDQ